MAANFDPYHAWLAIPQGMRPLNMYQLLGLQLFVTEPPKIAEGAARQLAKLQPHLSGPQAELARRLTAEINQAKATLLAPASRKQYDTQLRAQLGLAEPAAKPGPAAAQPAAKPAAAAAAKPAAAAPAVAMAAPAAMPAPAMSVPMTASAMGAPTMAMAPGVAMAMPVQGFPAAAAVPMAGQPMMAAPAMGLPMQAGVPFAAQPASMSPVVNTRKHYRKQSGSMGVIVIAILALGASAGGTYYAYNYTDLPKLLGLEPTDEVAQAPDHGLVTPKVGGGNQPGTRGYHDTDTDKVTTNPPPRRRRSDDPERTMTTQQGPANPDAMRRAEEAKNRAPVETAMAGSMTASEPPKEKRPTMKPVREEPTEEETSSVTRALVAARLAMGEHAMDRVEENLDLALVESSSAQSLKAVEQTRQLAEAVKQFWHAADEGWKGLKDSDEIQLTGSVANVIEVNEKKLTIRMEGKNRDFYRDKLPAALARRLAERWLAKDDPNSKMFLAVAIAVDPKGDLNEAKQMLQLAAAGGAQVGDLAAEFDQIKR